MKKLLSALLALLLSFSALAEHMGAPYEFRNSSVTNARIASGVTEIAEGAYYYCKDLQTLEVPATVTKIGDYAFDHCENLTELTVPNSVREIGECAFNYCMRIANLDLGNGVKTLGNYAFSCCFSLRQATIPQSVTSIGDYAFYNCRALDTLYIYSSVQTIGVSALEGCPRLTVYTPATSPAAAYCTQNGIKWVAIEEPEKANTNNPQGTESSINDDVQDNKSIHRAYILASYNIYLENTKAVNRTLDSVRSLFKNISINFDSIDTYSCLTGLGLKQLFDQISSVVDNNDVTYIYIYSHGFRNSDGTAGIYMNDSPSDDPDDYQGLKYKSFVEYYLSPIQGNVVVLLQPCYSGAAIEYAKEFLDPKRFSIISSCSADETAAGLIWELPRFTKILCESCAMPTRSADLNKDGKITLEEFKLYSPYRELWVLTVRNIEHTQVFPESDDVTRIF